MHEYRQGDRDSAKDLGDAVVLHKNEVDVNQVRNGIERQQPGTV